MTLLRWIVYFLIGLLIGSALRAQAPALLPVDIDTPTAPHVDVWTEHPESPVIFLDPSLPVPSGAVQLGTFTIQGMSGRQQDKITLRVFRVN